jgi:hypothetical protein
MLNAMKKSVRHLTLKLPQSLVRRRLRTLTSAVLNGTRSVFMGVRRAGKGLLSNVWGRKKSV